MQMSLVLTFPLADGDGRILAYHINTEGCLNRHINIIASYHLNI
jgi:hypothetical protein